MSFMNASLSPCKGLQITFENDYSKECPPCAHVCLRKKKIKKSLRGCLVEDIRSNKLRGLSLYDACRMTMRTRADRNTHKRLGVGMHAYNVMGGHLETGRSLRLPGQPA